MALRVGIGYDIHRVIEGRPLVLGGVTFDSNWGLEGHSDADVLCHAIGDAILGALALGDLGTHFPPNDPQWKNASSLDLLDRIRAMMMKERIASVVNVDATLVAEEPRIGPVRDRMRAKIAQALRVATGQVSIKATTNERLDAVGGGHGMAAWAVVMVEVE
jgi:2-C-methyl-D-erythritol 2,4-cyclodiphosphate synthase